MGIKDTDIVEIEYSEPIRYVDKNKEFDKLVKAVSVGIISKVDAIAEYYDISPEEAQEKYNQIIIEQKETTQNRLDSILGA